MAKQKLQQTFNSKHATNKEYYENSKDYSPDQTHRFNNRRVREFNSSGLVASEKSELLIIQGDCEYILTNYSFFCK